MRDVAVAASAISTWGLDDDKMEETLRLVSTEIHRLRDKAPTRAEFNRARDYAIGQMELALEGTENRMMALGEQVLAYGTASDPEAAKARLMRVTPAEVRRIAQDFLRADRLTCALVTPRKRNGRVREWLRAMA